MSLKEKIYKIKVYTKLFYMKFTKKFYKEEHLNQLKQIKKD
ncbi:hypothetical protein DOY81_001641 [Sarcophaga bullata]|nr:hypothetical protein DOY81_001641 [Sarcophaga bullata]